MPADPDPRFDPDRILATLDAHGVEYLLVGGLATRAHGAQRRTADVDCVPNDTTANLERLAAALRERNTRLRVGGMTDDEARQLPVVIDAPTLESFGSSTWMTDAGPLDLLVELRDRDGGRHSYGDLVERVVRYEVAGLAVAVASLDDIIESKEYADREKDREGLAELHDLRSRRHESPRCRSSTERTSAVEARPARARVILAADAWPCELVKRLVSKFPGDSTYPSGTR